MMLLCDELIDVTNFIKVVTNVELSVVVGSLVETSMLTPSHKKIAFSRTLVGLKGLIILLDCLRHVSQQCKHSMTNMYPSWVLFVYPPFCPLAQRSAHAVARCRATSVLRVTIMQDIT